MAAFKAVVPVHLRTSLSAWVEEGRLPSAFLEAVLCNDLRKAVEAADPLSFKAIPAIVKWLYTDAPALCWGDPTKVGAWMLNGGRQGLESERKRRISLEKKQGSRTKL